MGNLFDPERGLWRILSTLVDIFGLSILWLACCLPLFTIGPATAALYHAVVRCVRPREPGAFAAFLRSFAENFKTGAAATLICLGAAAVLACGYLVMRRNGLEQAGGAYILYVAYYVALILPAGVFCWVFPLLGRFVYGVKDLFRTAFQLTVAHLPSTVVVVLLVAQSTVFSLNRWWPALFMPAVTTLLVSLFWERIFQKHSPGTEEEPAQEE